MEQWFEDPIWNRIGFPKTMSRSSLLRGHVGMDKETIPLVNYFLGVALGPLNHLIQHPR